MLGPNIWPDDDGTSAASLSLELERESRLSSSSGGGGSLVSQHPRFRPSKATTNTQRRGDSNVDDWAGGISSNGTWTVLSVLSSRTSSSSKWDSMRRRAVQRLFINEALCQRPGGGKRDSGGGELHIESQIDHADSMSLWINKWVLWGTRNRTDSLPHVFRHLRNYLQQIRRMFHLLNSELHCQTTKELSVTGSHSFWSLKWGGKEDEIPFQMLVGSWYSNRWRYFIFLLGFVAAPDECSFFRSSFHTGKME